VACILSRLAALGIDRRHPEMFNPMISRADGSFMSDGAERRCGGC
jgi:hypothetical protein